MSEHGLELDLLLVPPCDGRNVLAEEVAREAYVGKVDLLDGVGGVHDHKEELLGALAWPVHPPLHLL